MTVLAVVLGLGLTVAGTASAQVETGTWRAYGNTNPITSSSSTWKCGATETVAPNVSAQVCAIRSHDKKSVQAAMIVRNNRSDLYKTYAVVNLQTARLALGAWDCPESGIGADSWSVCFGRTEEQSDPVRALGEVSYNIVPKSEMV